MPRESRDGCKRSAFLDHRRARGFHVGSNLIDLLLKRGDAVVVLDNFDPFDPRPTNEANPRDTCNRRAAEFSAR